jgi:hypothetical protein
MEASGISWRLLGAKGLASSMSPLTPIYNLSAIAHANIPRVKEKPLEDMMEGAGHQRFRA